MKKISPKGEISTNLVTLVPVRGISHFWSLKGNKLNGLEDSKSCLVLSDHRPTKTG
jgi:hypothetical protein